MDELTLTLDLISTVYQMAQRVKSNKERCCTLADRVKSFERLVLAIRCKGQDQISSLIKNALTDLNDTLLSAKYLMQKFYKTKAVKNFFKSSGHQDKFHTINEKLSYSFQVLCGAMQIEQVDILNRISDTVSDQFQSTSRPRIPSNFNNTPATAANIPATAATIPTTVFATPATAVATPLNTHVAHYAPATSFIPSVPVVRQMTAITSPGTVSFPFNNASMLFPQSPTFINSFPAYNYVGQTYRSVQYPSITSFAQSGTALPFSNQNTTLVTNQFGRLFY